MAAALQLLKIDVPNRTYNVLTRQVLRDLDAALDRIAAHPELRVLVIRGMKKTGFLAGADIQSFADLRSTDEAAALSAAGQNLFAKLELLPIPSIAVIHGPCLGGGLELALACDYRLVVDGPGTQLGLPEVELGLLPGWGGTQRLPRIVGLENALHMILQARRVKAPKALKLGLADARRTPRRTCARLDGLIASAPPGANGSSVVCRCAPGGSASSNRRPSVGPPSCGPRNDSCSARCRTTCRRRGRRSRRCGPG